MPPKKEGNPNAVRLLLTNKDFPIEPEPIKVLVDRTKPLSLYTQSMAKKLGKTSLDYTLCVAKGTKEKGYVAGAEIDMTQPVPLAAEKKTLVIFLKEGGGSPPGTPKKKATSKKSAAKPGGKASPPPNPTGKAAVKKSAAKPAPKASAGSDAGSSPGTPKKAAKKPPAKPDAAKPKKPKKPESASASPTEEASPAPEAVPPPQQTFLPPPGFPGGAVGLPASPLMPASPLIPPPPHRHPYQPYELDPRKQEFRRQLVEFYMKHNPSKLTTVDDILKTWEGEEDLLMQKLHEKYEAPQAAQLSQVFASSASPAVPTMVVSPGRGATSSPLDPRMLALATEQEMKLRREEERMNMEVQAKLDGALRELQEARRKDALEREERAAKERREREERESALKRDMERSTGERRALENLIRDREHEQRRREEDIERRDRELRQRQEEILAEKELLLRRELDSMDRYEAEEAQLRERTEKMLASIDPYASSQGASPSLQPALPKVSQVVSSIQQETALLKSELRDLHTQLKDSSALPSPGLQPATPASPGGGGGESLTRAKAEPDFLPVFDALTKAGMQKYASLFAAHQFNIAAFKRLCDEDLVELGITAVGARKRIIAEVERQKLAASVSNSVQQRKAQQQQQQQPPPSVAKKLPLHASSATFASPFLPSSVQAARPQPQPYHVSFGFADHEASQSRLRLLEDKIDTVHDIISAASSPLRDAPASAATTSPRRQVDGSNLNIPPKSTRAPPGGDRIPYGQIEWHHGVLEQFYNAIDPVKVPQVDQILGEYATLPGLESLYSTLAAIYELDPSAYAAKVRQVCREHHPYREAAAEVLCRICRGREAELITQLVEDGRGEASASVSVGAAGFSSAASVGSAGQVDPHAEAWQAMQRWTESEDAATGRTYYFSEVAQESQWSKPAVLAFRDSVLHDDVANMSQSAAAQRSTASRLPFSSLPPSQQLPRNPLPTESVGYADATKASRRARGTHYRAWVLAFLLKHDPGRVPEGTELLRNYAGREDVLVEELKQAYSR